MRVFSINTCTVSVVDVEDLLCAQICAVLYRRLEHLWIWCLWEALEPILCRYQGRLELSFGESKVIRWIFNCAGVGT